MEIIHGFKSIIGICLLSIIIRVEKRYQPPQRLTIVPPTMSSKATLGDKWLYRCNWARASSQACGEERVFACQLLIKLIQNLRS